jgi:uncharacterized membrane protein YfcA
MLYLLLGLIAGMVGGALGLGGGAIMVPAFVLLFGLTQHQAQGTALAVMLPPIFLLAVLRYYWAGHVKVQMAIYVAIGFIIGALLGAHFVQGVPDVHLKRAFGIFLMIIGLKMAFMK